MVRLRGTALSLLLATLTVACDGSPTAPSPTTVTPVTPVTPEDFSGQVLTPSHRDQPRSYSEAVPGVSVTIIAGPRSGENVLTTSSGQYTFPEVDGDELHIRLEKAGYEPKEVIVHRTRATVLRDDPVPLEYGGPQDRPGTVLIGVAWPEYAKEVLEKMPVIADLLLILTPGTGSYGWGVITQDDPRMTPESAPLLHELCHAWQHGVVRPRGGGTGGGTDWFAEWVASPEGLAYREAREKDREELGNNPVNVAGQTGGNWVESELILSEESAQFCTYWWGDGSDWTTTGRVDVAHWRAWLRQHTPNRADWLERFLGL